MSFTCMECGRAFRTTKSAEKAARVGCPNCGGVDIDLDVPSLKIPASDKPKPVFVDPILGPCVEEGGPPPDEGPNYRDFAPPKDCYPEDVEPSEADLDYAYRVHGGSRM